MTGHRPGEKMLNVQYSTLNIQSNTSVFDCSFFYENGKKI